MEPIAPESGRSSRLIVLYVVLGVLTVVLALRPKLPEF